MNVPKDTKPMIWGAVIGAALCTVIGFTWGGWVTGGTARKTVAAAAHDATVMALAPLCAERFRAQGDATARMAELATTSSWERRGVIEKSGFAVMPGATTNDSDLATACVEILLAPAKPKT
jgi:alpha/beta superfamily hydrolase